MNNRTYDSPQIAICGLAIRFGEAPVAFGQVRGNRKGGSVQLINEKVITARELLGQRGNPICQINRLLVDLQVFEHKCHGEPQRREQLNRRPAVQRTAGHSERLDLNQRPPRPEAPALVSAKGRQGNAL